MLKVEKLSIKNAKTIRLNSLEFSFNQGEIIGILGPNGSGKTTLINALSGELDYSGRVLLDDIELKLLHRTERAQRIAVLSKMTDINFDFSVEEIVSFGRVPYCDNKKYTKKIVSESLIAMNAYELIKHNYLKLSTGEQQRVNIARVCTQIWPGNKGTLLLLDEPTSALDPLHENIIFKVITTFAKKGTLVVIVLHDLNLAARYCNRILLLKNGNLIILDKVLNVLNPKLLYDVFGINVFIKNHPYKKHPIIIFS